MLVERGSALYVYAPIKGPPGWVPGPESVIEAALLGEGADADPADWHEAAWEGTEARYRVDTDVWPDGRYVLKWRVTAAAERWVSPGERVTIGAATP